MNPAAQANEYTVAWAAPEILEGADAITREADVFAFGMIAIEVCPRTLPHLVLTAEGWMVRLISEPCLRFLREGIRSMDSQPEPLTQVS